MERLRKIVRHHFLAIMLAVIVGLITIGPNLVFMQLPEYQGIPIFGIQDEEYYLARYQAAYSGCYWNCNPFVRDEQPPAFPDASLSEPILILPGIIFGMTAVQLDMFYEFFFPFVLTLLFYWLLYRMTKSRSASLLGSTAIICGYYFFNVTDLISIPDLWWIVHSNTYAYTTFLPYTRPVNPQFSSCIFLLYGHVLLSYFETRKRSWLIAVAFISAFSWYVYVYLSTYILVVNFAVLAMLFLQKEYRNVVRYAAAIACSLMLALPLLFNLYAAMRGGPALSSEFIVHTHAIAYSYSGIILLLIAILFGGIYVSRNPYSQPFYFIASLVVASFLVLEQHVLTGIQLEIFHYNCYYNTPVLVFATCYLGVKCIPIHFKFFARASAVLGTAIVLIGAVHIQYDSFLHWYPYTISIQKYMPQLEELQNRPSGQLYTSEDAVMLHLVPIYTHQFVPDAPYASVYSLI